MDLKFIWVPWERKRISVFRLKIHLDQEYIGSPSLKGGSACVKADILMTGIIQQCGAG